MLDFASSSDVQEPLEAVGAAAALPPDTDILDAYSNAVISVADTVGPAVLRVETQGANGRRGGVGSGVTIAPDGLVLTNCHVVDGAKDVRLLDAEGRVMEARKLGVDPDTDLALLARELGARPRLCPARRFQAAQARAAGGRHRQPARL